MHVQLTPDIQLYLAVSAGLCLVAYLLGVRRRQMAAQQDNRHSVERIRSAANTLQKIAASLNARIREHHLHIAQFEQRVTSRDAVDLREIDRTLSLLRRLTSDLGGASSQIDEQLVELKVLAESRVDALTGIANRRSFDEQIHSSLTRYRNRGQRFALAMLDVDHFKGINDKFGHLTGDKVLQHTARLMVDGTRVLDHVMRIGGDEFAIVMVDTDMADAGRAVERIRRAVEQALIETGEHSTQVTISAGVVVVQPDDTTESLLQRADAALYEAKQQGRNRTHLHTDDPAPSTAETQGAPEAPKDEPAVNMTG